MGGQGRVRAALKDDRLEPGLENACGNQGLHSCLSGAPAFVWCRHVSLMQTFLFTDSCFFFLAWVSLLRVGGVSSYGSGEGAARRDLSADRPEVDSGRDPLHSQGCGHASSLEECLCAVFSAPGCCALLQRVLL